MIKEVVLLRESLAMRDPEEDEEEAEEKDDEDDGDDCESGLSFPGREGAPDRYIFD